MKLRRTLKMGKVQKAPKTRGKRNVGKSGSKPEPGKPEPQPAPTVAAPKSEAVEKYTRIQSVADALRGGAGTREEILDRADNLYVQHGGTSNRKETAWALMHSRATLLAFGFATETDGRLTLKGA
jgi:hypothetical protein